MPLHRRCCADTANTCCPSYDLPPCPLSPRHLTITTATPEQVMAFLVSKGVGQGGGS